MPKRPVKRHSLNSVSSSPSTPTHVPKQRRDHIFVTPKSHQFDDDDNDQDSSPYCLSFSQRAMQCGAEVTWGKRTQAVSSKSKPYVPQHTQSPPARIHSEIDDKMEPTTPKGLPKFLKELQQRGFLSGIENETNDTRSVSNTVITNRMDFNDNRTSNRSTDDGDFVTALDDDGKTRPNISNLTSNSTNYKQFLDDSIDMELMLCSQKIEQEISRIAEPPNVPKASKGFIDVFSDNDDDDTLLANLDAPLIDDKPLMQQKLTFARHKSIAIHPNSSSNENSACPNTSSNNVMSTTALISSCKSVSIKTDSSNPTTISSPAKPFIRHKSMPSPSVRAATTRQCTPQEIEEKRQAAAAKLKLTKSKLKNMKK